MTEREDASTSDIVGFAFTRKKVKYSVLDEMLPESMLDTTVTFFIDMKYMLDIMRIDYYKQAVTNELIPNSNRVIAEFMNLVVHYRRYLVEKRNCKVTFLLMFDDGKVDPIKLEANAAYGTKKMEKTVKPTFLQFIGKKIQRIAPCLPGMKVVDSGSNELTCIPYVLTDTLKSKYNIFLSDDPLLQMLSSTLPNCFSLRPNGVHSKSVGRNGYFRHLYEKNKWVISDDSEMKIDDSYIRLFLNLTGWDDGCPIADIKNKKAVKIINKLKESDIKFINYDALADHPEFKGRDDLIEELRSRDVCYNPHIHAAMIKEADSLHIINQYSDSNRPSREEFSYYNREYFGNVVDETTLFMV